MNTRTLGLIKGGHKYVFRYAPGFEDEVVDAITELAEDPGTPLDWVDAATLSFQVATYVASDCQQALRHRAGDGIPS